MNLYNLNKSQLKEIKSQPFKLEKDIQQIAESNLQMLFGLEFVKTEFQLNGLRIDTLAFDKQSNAFVIIEYKKAKSFSVVDQGYSYLSLLLNNKADFILEYQEQSGKILKRNEVDWSQSRVVFIAPQFTTYQKQSIEFKDLPFELWEIKRYEKDLIMFNQHKSNSQVSVNTISNKDERAQQVSEEIKVYTEEDHLAKASEATKELYIDLKERITALDEVEINPVKQYIGFKVGKKIFCDLEIQKKQLKMRINLKQGDLDDHKEMFRDVSNVGHWGLGHYEALIVPDTDLDYLMSLIKQSYKFHEG
ncbi:Predicted transport protein [Marivirga sericea]|uniref:Predicted transport protein n=1 Tax=Marivirga sericea TaxID=1028 RepID=A0A1X7INK3_9BACT|nr:DUF5655 domain-containing protein [Marivirga sericea]SMG16592.1 Predicted transport protein [Marivirga sericea]